MIKNIFLSALHCVETDSSLEVRLIAKRCSRFSTFFPPLVFLTRLLAATRVRVFLLAAGRYFLYVN